MERDWDIIREILIKLEKTNPDEKFVKLSDFPEEKHFIVSYNAKLLIDAGLVQGKIMPFRGVSPKPADLYLENLTWNGHEFLDTIKNDTVWQKTKESFLSRGLDMSLDLVKSVAIDIAATIIKKAAGL